MNMIHFGAGAKELLQSISEKQGKRMNSPESAEDIPKFIEFFQVWRLTLITEKKLFLLTPRILMNEAYFICQ